MIAADEAGLSAHKARNDFEDYLKGGRNDFPHYVVKFLDNGRETILSMKVYDYWKVF